MSNQPILKIGQKYISKEYNDQPMTWEIISLTKNLIYIEQTGTFMGWTRTTTVQSFLSDIESGEYVLKPIKSLSEWINSIFNPKDYKQTL